MIEFSKVSIKYLRSKHANVFNKFALQLFLWYNKHKLNKEYLKNGYNEPTRLSGKSTNSWNNKDLDTTYSQMDFEAFEKQILSN